MSLIARSPQRAALAAAIAIGAVAVGLGVAFVVNDLREADVAGQDPSATASIIESTLPSPSATVRPPSITPTPAPREPPAVAAVQWPLGLAAMTVVDGLRVRSHPLGADESTIYEPVLPQGTRLRGDGTYSGVAIEGAGQPAFYYGTDDDLAEKRYALNDLQDSLKGIGQIDIVFWEGNVNRGELRNITLMGDRLEYDFFHRSEYGPLTYRLYRLGIAG
jgi:hypothetical protein